MMNTTLDPKATALFLDGEADELFCPRCKTEVGRYSFWIVAADHIEHERCPICDCELECDDEGGGYEWCEPCFQKCRGRRALEQKWDYERHIDREIAFRRGK